MVNNPNNDASLLMLNEEAIIAAELKRPHYDDEDYFTI